MASQNGSITTNEIYGRSITLNWSIASQSSATNKTVINYSIVGSGSLSGDYYVLAGPITVTINGTNVYTVSSTAQKVAIYKQTLKSDTIEIPHNDDGSKTFSASISASLYDYSSINATASNSWTLPTIPRYATCNQSLASKTETSITMNWTSDNTIDRVWYSTNGGTSFTLAGDVNATSGSYTISGLTANTTYSIKTRVRRKDSQLTTDSTATSVKTYANVTQSLVSKTVNSITMKWTLDTEADKIWYSIGSGWIEIWNGTATTGTYTITGLTPNKDYNVYVRARRKSTQTLSDTLSNPVKVKTYDIARIKSSSNWTIGNNTSVTYDNPSGASISIGIFNTAGTVVYASYRTPASSPYTFQFTSAENTALYNSIPDDPSGTVRIYLRTAVNGTSYYDFVDRTITANQSINKPTFSNFTYADVNTNVTALTGNNQILVNGLSNVTVTISTANKAVAKNGASMDYYRITVGTKVTTVAYSSNADVTATINSVNGANISVEAVDTRGFGTIITKTATWKNYWNSKIETYKADRENGIGTKILIDVRGKFWAGNFGNTQNSVLSIVYRYKEKSASSYGSGINITDSFTYDNTNGTFVSNSGAFLPTTNNGTTPQEFEVGKEYDIQFSVYDQAYQSTSGATVTLRTNSGIPGRDLYKDSNGNYHEGINQLADPNYALAVGGRMIESDTVKEKWLSTGGWYRVAEIPNSNTASIFNISTTYNNRNNTSFTLVVNTAHDTATMNVLNICNNFNIIYYAKIMQDGGKNYLEIYYNAEVGNTVRVEMLSKNYNVKLLDFIASQNTGTKITDVTLVTSGTGARFTGEISSSGTWNRNSWANGSVGAFTQIIDTSGGQHTILMGKTADGQRQYSMELYDSATANDRAMRFYVGRMGLQLQENKAYLQYFKGNLYSYFYGLYNLYNNDTGSNGTITLSETVANFAFVDVYFKDNNGYNGSIRIYLPNGKYTNLSYNLPTTDTTYFKNRMIAFSGTSIVNVGSYYNQTTAKASGNTVTNGNYLYITRVDGFRVGW